MATPSQVSARLRAVPPAPRARPSRAAVPPSKALQLIGAVLGAFVPICAFGVAHRVHALAGSGELEVWRGVLGVFFTIAALAFSAPTVYQWGVVAFRGRVKAAGFVVLCETGMIAAEYLGLAWMSWAALAVLVGINAAATGANFGSKGKIK